MKVIILDSNGEVYENSFMNEATYACRVGAIERITEVKLQETRYFLKDGTEMVIAYPGE